MTIELALDLLLTPWEHKRIFGLVTMAAALMPIGTKFGIQLQNCMIGGGMLNLLSPWQVSITTEKILFGVLISAE